MLTGTAHYIDDITFEDMHYLGFVRSSYAHAQVKKVNTEKVLRKKEVALVLTGQDTPIPLPIQNAPKGMRQYTYYALARDKVRYVGEAVAAVVANSRSAAEDAAELVEVEYETLPAVASYEKAMRPDAPLVNPECGSNVIFEKIVEWGNINAAFESAYGRVVLSFRIARQAAVPIEPRGIVAYYDPKVGRLQVWSPTKNPHSTRRLLSQVLHFEESRIRVIVPEIGGGFGTKASVYPEDAVASIASIRLGKPVKWIEDRQENFLTAYHGRDQIHEVEAAYDKDGLLLGFRDRFCCDIGAPGLINLSAGQRTIPLLAGCYRIPNVLVEGKWIATNKAPTGPVRGNGRPEALFVIERTIDAIARRLGIDAAGIRLRNMVTSSELPYDTHLGSVIDSGDFPGAMKKVLEHADYPRLVQERETARKQGRYLGIGIGCYIEDTGAGFETAYLSVEDSGKILLRCGSQPHGQGLETSLSQICAQELGGLPQDLIKVTFGDTDVIPEGTGTFGSRSLVVGGSAVKIASNDLRKKLVKVGAKALGVPETEIVCDRGKIFLRSDPRKSLTLLQLAQYARRNKNPELDLEASCKWYPPNITFASGAHLAIVEVDPETGQLRILRYVAADDCGRMINRTIAEGQIIGGIVHGIGDAVLGELVYSEEAQLLTTSFMDYAIPTTLEIPKIELVEHETHSSSNPLGAKGAGEGGTIGALATIANAVADALAPFGVEVTEVPLTPKRIWMMLHQR